MEKKAIGWQFRARQGRTRTAFGVGLFGAVFVLSSCAGEDNQTDTILGTGEAEVRINTIPEDVHCVRVRAVGRRSVERTVDVVPGQTAVVRMSSLPSGEVDFYGDAFERPCDDLDTGAVGSWVGGPEKVEIKPPTLAHVALVLRRNGRGLVSLFFEEDPDTGGPCVGEEPGCLSPEDAYGPSGQAPPDGARMVSPSEFLQGLKRGDYLLSSARIERHIAEMEKAEMEADRETLEQLLANQPDLLKWLLTSPAEEEGKLKTLVDGTHLLTLETERGQEPQQVITMGQRFTLSEVANSLRRFPTHSNQLAIYTNLFEGLPQNYLIERQLPPPEEVQRLSARELIGLNDSIAADLASILKILPPDPNQPPSGYPASCAAEDGSASILRDQTGGSCTPSASSIWSSHLFPLKWYSTCVKNQGRRGSCVAFGVAGGLEAAIAKKHKRWVNLSDQRLYYWAKAPTTYGDGLNTTGVMGTMVGSFFTFPWEFHWDYNPSPNRIDLSPTPAYSQSCVGYNEEHCSNTAHQGDIVCTNVLFLTYCVNDGSAPSSSGYRLTGTSELWNFGAPVASLLGRLQLALGIPLVLSFSVTPRFDNATSNGIVTWAGSGETNRGGHAVTVLGFIDNDQLPQGIPNGAGGGYFIVKNSWGKCWKDGGYVYLPYQWVETYGYSLNTISGVN